MALLELRGISSHYGNVQALKGVSLHVNEGELVTLLGANGAGKSTTLKTISGLIVPTEGEVLFEGKPIHRAGPEAIARLGISHVPEGRRIFPGLTVRENILLGASNRKGVPRKQLEKEASCSWSRTRTWRCRSPIAATCSRPAPSPSKARRRNCWATSRCAPRISAAITADGGPTGRRGPAPSARSVHQPVSLPSSPPSWDSSPPGVSASTRPFGVS